MIVFDKEFIIEGIKIMSVIDRLRVFEEFKVNGILIIIEMYSLRSVYHSNVLKYYILIRIKV
jgi:hypothetical protein